MTRSALAILLALGTATVLNACAGPDMDDAYPNGRRYSYNYPPPSYSSTYPGYTYYSAPAPGYPAYRTYYYRDPGKNNHPGYNSSYYYDYPPYYSPLRGD